MHIAGIVLGCMLLGQAAGPHAARPAEMVDQAMLLPANSAVAGRPLGLLAAIQSTADRRGQLEIVRSYWRLVEAVGEYRYCLNHAEGLEQIRAGRTESAVLRSSKAATAAQLREAELGAVRAQHELAELARLPAGVPLPLPADHPTTVAYRTYFNEMFAGKTPPEAARLADKLLPLERRVIDDQAAAVQAAEDALIAVADDRQMGRAGAAAQISLSGQLLDRQRAFIRSVCAYNRTIADYGLTVMPLSTSPQELVTVLIGVTASTAPAATSPPVTFAIPAAPGDAQPVLPATALEPVDGHSAPPTAKHEPTPAPPLSRRESPSQAPRTANKPLAKTLPAETSTSPAFFAPSAGRSASSAVLYPALVGASPAVQAKQLTIAVHWDRSLPKELGVSAGMSLADCLLRASGGDRPKTIHAYWLVRQRTAEYQILLQQAEFFDSLAPEALEHRNTPTGAADMLRLQAMQTAARAAVDQAVAALVEAQYALALRIGAVNDAAWPLASTVPHSGGYLLKLEAQPRDLAESWTVRRLAATMPGLGADVQQRAAAVVEADGVRAEAAEKYHDGTAAIEQVLDGIAGQTEQTIAFLDSLTEYNQAIADYAIAVSPPGTSVAELVASLVTKP